MKIYFYCSYEHSQTGFFLSELIGQELVPAQWEQGCLPTAVRDFFSIDRYRFLWTDLCASAEAPWLNPQPVGGFCGIRGLSGAMAGGRNCTVNLAFYASGEEEMVHLRRISLAILGSFDSFQTMLFESLNVGGPCSYQLDGDRFTRWLALNISANRLKLLVEPKDPAAKLLPYLQRPEPPKFETDLLHLAVCTCPWQEIYETKSNKLLWMRKPKCVLSVEEFRSAFTGRDPLWQLNQSDAPGKED